EFVNSRELMFDFFLLGGRGPAHRAAFSDAIAMTPWIAAFAPVDADPISALPNIPEVGSIWGALDEAIATIYDQAYTEEVPDARAALQRAADAVRAAVTGG
ncbi:MAG: hypothetical protein MUP76_10905, partial [Acidimicrobiia bacterium]|nr:hypothetical protein [Acidimicrobiia bacterium]